MYNMLTFQITLTLFAVGTAAVSWQNVHTGGGGGFTPGIVFHPNIEGVAYARCDIGGIYKLNSDDSWTAVTDSLATDAGWYEHPLSRPGNHPTSANDRQAQLGC